MQGEWTLYELLDGGTRTVLDHVELPDDCFGDDLFDRMDGVDWNEYETEGDNEYVAVIPKRKGLPSYGWEFVANGGE